MNFYNLLQNQAKKYKDKPAIIFNDVPISFSQLKENAFRLANGLLSLGIEKSEEVAIFLPNCPEYIYSYLAIFSLCAVGVPLDFMLKDDELISCLNHSEAKVLITKSREGVNFKEIKENTPGLKEIILLDEERPGFLSWDEFLSGASKDLASPVINDKDPSLIMYTSGSTGRPKGVLLNYRHLDGAPEAMKYFVDLTDKDVKLCALPLSHGGGLVYLQNCVYFGITLVLMERFIPIEFLKNIQKYKVTCFHLVPSMYLAILQLKEFKEYDLSSLRWVDVFGAPSSPDVLKRFNLYCPKTLLLNGWGLTETNAPNAVTPMGSKKIESVGKPAPWIELKIFDRNDKEVPQGDAGEICMRSWVVMDGYYKDHEATAEVIRDGWFHTGDLGRFDDEGFLYIVGRIKEMIKVGGLIVYAPEVEAAIHKHPDVAEVAVVGVADKLRGEVVKAFVVPRDEKKLAEEDIRYFCRQHLAHFKVPHYVEFRTTLPKTRSGKIDKEALKNE